MPRTGLALALALALALTAPVASAFSSASEPLEIAYAANATPTMVSSGALFLDGDVSVGIAIGGAQGTSLDRVPHLTVVDRSLPIPVNASLRDATLVFESGAFVWTFPKGVSADLATSERYAIGVALPDAPLPRETADGPRVAGFILASEGVTGTLGWTQGLGVIVPLDAVVTIRDARGQPVPGWDAKRVNAGASANEDPDGLQYGFAVEGAFTTRIASQILAGATGGANELRLVLGPAEEDRYAETTARFSEAAGDIFGPDSPLTQDGGPLSVFESASGVLNGALLVIPGAAGGQGPEPVLLESTFGGEEFPLGPFTLIRGDDMELAWSPSEMRLSGTPTVALGAQGFAVNEPARVGIFPIVSLLFWLAAIGAVVYYFVKRPPKAPGAIGLRLASMGVYLLALVVVLWLWDRSFEQTFGTGFVSQHQEGGFSPDNLPRLGVTLALELAPWGIAALLFALPVRIAAGVGLRYLGHGKSLKGVASAAGLVSLAIFGPIYALWCFNLVWSRMANAMPGFAP